MNAELLKRLFRAINDGTETTIENILKSIIEDTRSKKQVHLARELEELMATKRIGASSKVLFESPNLSTLQNLKTNKKSTKDHLVTVFDSLELDPHLILSPAVENNFLRIEKEYAARHRLNTYGLKPFKKILLYGAPGNGKTLGAKRLAKNTGLKLVKVKFDTMMSSLFGESASNLRSIFDEAAKSPCLLLLDECDFIARSRTASRDVGEVPRIVNTLLQLLEDYDLPGLIVATTNLHSELDKALFRRFDLSIEIPLPGTHECRKIMELALAAIKLHPKLDWVKICSILAGHSAADVVKVANYAAKNCVLEGNDVITQTHFDTALDAIL